MKNIFLNALDSLDCPRGSRVIVAVSGGADSVALLWLFRSFWDGEIIIAHAEHGIRGEESQNDYHLVLRLGTKFGVECVAEHLNVPGNIKKGESVEMAARRLRYEFFERVCAEKNAFGVALGHNRDDVAETFLLNLFRGTGVRGLAGIPKRRGIFFRPLLGFSHTELCAILREQNIEWREDATNSENKYLRNKIRNILIPLIKEEINPRAAEHIADATSDLEFFRAFEEDEGRKIFEKILQNDKEKNFFSLKKIRVLDDHEIKFFLRETGRRMNVKTLSRERTDKLVSLLQRSGNFIFQWQKNFTLAARNGQLEMKIV